MCPARHDASGDVPYAIPTMQKRTKGIILTVTVIIVLGILAFIYYRSLTTPPPDGGGLETAPVIAPEVSELDELERYVNNKPVPPRAASGSLFPLSQYDHVYGNRDASTLVFLYTNITNPFARLMLPELMSLTKESLDVALVFRHFPDESEGDLRTSLIAECVALQVGEDGFWPYVERVVGAPQHEEVLALFATEVGADAEMAFECADERRTWNFVLSQRQQGELRSKIGISPSLVIWHRPTDDVRILAGANPMSYVNKVLADMR